MVGKGFLQVLGIAGSEVIYECRRCGVKLSEESEVCPECGSEEIASYELE